MVQCTYLSVVLIIALFMNVRAVDSDDGSGSDDETIDSPITREPIVTTSSHNIMSSSILVSIAPSSSLFGQPLSSVPLLVSSPTQSLSSSSSLPAHNNLVSSEQIFSVLSSASSSSPSAPSPTPIPGTAATSPNDMTTSSDNTVSSEGTDSPTNAFNPTSPPGESQESIASISIFLILMLLGVSVMLVHVFIKIKFHYLPESIAFVIIGCVVGALFWGTQRLGGKDLQYWENFSPQSFFLVLLPPIIFESGYSLHKGNFFQNLGSIMMFAVVGTTISAAIVGGGLYALGVMGVAYPLDIYQSFTFGSLISAVDPVATLAIFHALNVDPTLNMLVFGESVLNDAVSIVLTKTILQQLPSEASSAVNTSAAEILGNSAGQFCIMFFGSALLGTVFALISALFLKVINLRKHHSLEFTMWVIFAFGPYFLAEGLHLSGIMAVLFCGIVMSHYTHFNLSPVTQVTVQQSLRTVSFMAETVVFLYLGMALFSINKSFNLGLIVWSLVLILIARAANIFPLSAMMNCCRSVKINMRMQCVMWFSGLRGAVAFALAENLDEYFPKEVTGYLVTTTLLIVLFTIIILGGSTMPLLKFLKAGKGSTLSKTEDQGTAVNSAPAQQFAQVLPPRNYRSISNWFMYLDYKYVKPFLIRRFTRQEVSAARHEMQRQTAEWYRGVREAPSSDKEEDIEDTDHSASSALLQNL